MDIPLVLLHMEVVRHEKESIGLIEGLKLYFLHLLYDRVHQLSRPQVFSQVI